jgi:anti-sigma B factor antagonist
VSYIDSSGIASFVEGYQRARKDRLQFGLVAASPAVLSVLNLARLESVFPLHTDLAAARAAGGTA